MNYSTYDKGYLTKKTTLQETNTPIYWEAFSDYYYQVWKGIKEVWNSQDEIRELCFYRSLTCFYNETDEDYTDRQALLYHYLKRGFRYKDENSLLNKYKEILPINSDCKNVLNQVCMAYDEPPKRKFSNSKTLNDVYKAMYSEANIDTIFATIYELAKGCGTVAVAPIFKNGKLKVVGFTPDQFKVTYEPDNQWKVAKITYPDWNDETSEYIYHEWTDSTYRILDYRGNLLTEFVTQYRNTGGENPYGKIPFIFLKIGRGTGILPGGKMDMIYNQLRINKTLFASEIVMGLTGFPIPLGVNLDTRIISPDHILGAQSGLTKEDQDPDFRWVTPETAYANLLEYSELLKDAEKMRYGIPTGEGADASGISRVISRQQLIDERYKDLPNLRQFEKEFVEMLRHIGIIDGVIQTQDELTFSVDFADIRVYIEPDIEREQDWSKVEKGEWAVEDYYTKWGLFDEGISETKLIKLLTERMEKLKAVKEIIGSKVEEEEEEPIEEKPIEEPKEQEQEQEQDIEEDVKEEQTEIKNEMKTNE